MGKLTKCHDGFLTDRPPERCFVVWPYYTGRDKGCLHDGRGNPLLFAHAGHAWWYVFTVAQPNDLRAKDNYRVVTLGEYRAA